MDKIITSYDEVVEFLCDIPKFTTKNSMEDTKKFLELFPIPYEKVQFIHVAGTNGKGSTCAYINGILGAAGYKCGLFTSPHLVDMRERFMIENNMVSKELFFKAFQVVKKRLDEFRNKNKAYFPTFFETLFFMGLVLFCEESTLDYIILETGLGGRLDATNGIAEKKLCVITPLGLDHTQYLGNTIEKIAMEKCGIIKENTPLVFWNSDAKINGIITDYATKKKCSLVSVSKKDYIFLKNEDKSIDFLYKSSYYEDINLTLCTKALYQQENCVLALKSVETLLGKERILSKEAIKEAVFNVKWAGRMEQVLPRIYLDGAHNIEGIQRFLETIMMDRCIGKRELIFSAVMDKNYKEMMMQVLESGLFERIIFTQIKNCRGIGKEEVFESLPKTYQSKVLWKETSVQAIKLACDNQGQNDYIYVAGSLYLVGEVKNILHIGKLDAQ